MKISYVLPVYNAQNTLNQCVHTLINQDENPHEIIIINDCSTDYTTEVLCSVFGLSSKIKIHNNNERKGAAYCRNYGNSLATGDVIAVCDADFYYPERSQAIKGFFNLNKEKSVFYSGLDCVSVNSPQEQCYMDAIEWDFNSKCPISHPTVAYKKCVADDIKYHEDSIETDLYEFFLLDAHRKGYLFGGCQNPLMKKIEGDTKRNRDFAVELKKKKYKEYGINI